MSTHSEAGHGTVKSYLLGFVLSLVLTLLPFWMVLHGDFSRGLTLVAIYVAAVVQILVQLYFFLHLNRSSSARWNRQALIFTALIILLFLGGTLWVMFDLNMRMM